MFICFGWMTIIYRCCFSCCHNLYWLYSVKFPGTNFWNRFGVGRWVPLAIWVHCMQMQQQMDPHSSAQIDGSLCTFCSLPRHLHRPPPFPFIPSILLFLSLSDWFSIRHSFQMILNINQWVSVKTSKFVIIIEI